MKHTLEVMKNIQISLLLLSIANQPNSPKHMALEFYRRISPKYAHFAVYLWHVIAQRRT